MLCLVAFLFVGTLVGTIALVQIALIIEAVHIKKQIIKTPKSWLPLVLIALSILMLVPYVSLFNAKEVDGERFT